MLLIPVAGRQRQVNLWVQGQPELYSKTFSQKKNRPSEQLNITLASNDVVELKSDMRKGQLAYAEKILPWISLGIVKKNIIQID